MTRRTFVLLVCRVIGLASLLDLVSSGLGYSYFSLIPVRSNFSNEATPAWIYVVAAIPSLYLAAGVVLGSVASRVAKRFAPPVDDSPAPHRVRSAIVVFVGFAGLSGVLAEATRVAILTWRVSPAAASSPFRRMVLPTQYPPAVGSLVAGIVLIAGIAWLSRFAFKSGNMRVYS